MSYAGSSVLARQIQEGAPADVFISANADWMDTAEASGDLRAHTRRDMLGNRLVLVAHGRGAKRVKIDETLELADMLGDGRLTSPAGKRWRPGSSSLPSSSPSPLHPRTSERDRIWMFPGDAGAFPARCFGCRDPAWGAYCPALL